MNRKNFIRTVGVAGAGIMTGGYRPFAQLVNEGIIKGRKLKIGDTVGLIAPGSFITEKELEEAVTNIRSLGLKPYYTDNILAKEGYLAGTDKQRAEDLNRMFANPKVKALWAVRGGYGCVRILDMLDYSSIRRNPKIVIGYSDITVLLYGIFSQTGLIGFHGPVAISTFDEFSVAYLKSILFGDSTGVKLIQSPVAADSTVIRSGKATGRLVGGNLSLVVSLIGTKYDVETKGKIIFLEEIGEEPYRIDRMLTQMIQAGKFNGAAGIALGNFRKCEIKKNDPEFDSSFSLSEVLFDRLFDLGIPVIYGLSFGHIDNKYTLPFGALAELNVFDKSITLSESAVI